jgi:hypothetical protein
MSFDDLKIIAAFGGFIMGVLNLSYTIYKDFLLKSKIKGKITNIVSYTLDGEFCYKDMLHISHKVEGISYVLQLSVIALNRTFNLKKIKVIFRYTNDKTNYEATVYATPFNSITPVNGENKQLNISENELIPLLHILEKDKNNLCYLTCIVEKQLSDETKIALNSYRNNRDDDKYNQLISQKAIFSEIDIYFYDYKEKYILLNLKTKDIDPKLFFYNENVFK